MADAALFLMVAVWVKELTGSDGAAALVFGMIGLAAFSPRSSATSPTGCRVAVCWWCPIWYGSRGAEPAPGGVGVELWLVYTVMFVYGCSAYVTASAQSGLIRDLLPDEFLAAGNGVLSTIDRSLRLVSPLLGTALYVAAGVGPVVVLTAVCFAVTAFLLARLQVSETPPEGVADGDYVTSCIAGFRHLVAHPGARR